MKILILIILILFPLAISKPLITQSPNIKLKEKDLKCLIENIYHEARGEIKEGWEAITNVVINRLKHPAYPSSICEIIYQPRQFSWTSNKVEIKDQNKYNEIKVFIENKMKFHLSTNIYDDNTNGALFYHSVKLGELWKDKTVTIGNHVFYKRYKR